MDFDVVDEFFNDYSLEYVTVLAL